jgi:hypothetical protein
MKQGLAEVRARLGAPGASARAAAEVLDVLASSHGEKSLTDASFHANV